MIISKCVNEDNPWEKIFSTANFIIVLNKYSLRHANALIRWLGNLPREDSLLYLEVLEYKIRDNSKNQDMRRIERTVRRMLKDARDILAAGEAGSPLEKSDFALFSMFKQSRISSSLSGNKKENRTVPMSALIYLFSLVEGVTELSAQEIAWGLERMDDCVLISGSPLWMFKKEEKAVKEAVKDLSLKKKDSRPYTWLIHIDCIACMNKEIIPQLRTKVKKLLKSLKDNVNIIIRCEEDWCPKNCSKNNEVHLYKLFYQPKRELTTSEIELLIRLLTQTGSEEVKIPGTPTFADLLKLIKKTTLEDWHLVDLVRFGLAVEIKVKNETTSITGITKLLEEIKAAIEDRKLNSSPLEEKESFSFHRAFSLARQAFRNSAGYFKPKGVGNEADRSFPSPEDIKAKQEEEWGLLEESSKKLTPENQTKISELLPIIREIDSLEEGLSRLSDKELKNKTNEFKVRFKAGETLDGLLPEAFAVVREASLRVSGERHYNVQMLGGIAIHQQKIVEIGAGEGKTLVSTLPGYLRFIGGQKVHIITHNPYLSLRDFKINNPLYQFLGVQASVRGESKRYSVLRKAYEAEILFTTTDTGFDLMRGTIDASLLGEAFAIIDEADYSLIDLNGNALVLARQREGDKELFKIIKRLSEIMKEGYDYEIKPLCRIELTNHGKKSCEELLEKSSYQCSEESKKVAILFVQWCLSAWLRYQKGIHYVVRVRQVIPIDGFTGRLKIGHRFALYDQQFIELKEGIKAVDDEHVKTLPLPVFFNYYREKAGMTGTIDFPVPREELSRIYGISDVVVIPTKCPSQRQDLDPRVFLDKQGRNTSLLKRAKEYLKKI